MSAWIYIIIGAIIAIIIVSVGTIYKIRVNTSRSDEEIRELYLKDIMKNVQSGAREYVLPNGTVVYINPDNTMVYIGPDIGFTTTLAINRIGTTRGVKHQMNNDSSITIIAPEGDQMHIRLDNIMYYRASDALPDIHTAIYPKTYVLM